MKNAMKNVIRMLAAATVIVLLVGSLCGAGLAEESLVGTWEWTESGDLFSACLYRFFPNGEYAYYDAGIGYAEQGTYTVDGTALILTLDNGFREIWNVSLQGNLLSMSDGSADFSFCRQPDLMALAMP